jgi:hypothetical protein
MEVVMAVPPNDPRRDPAYRRYWGYSNRPFAGCGCLYALLLFVLVWWLLSFLFPPFAFWL